ncbi:adenylate/guanylate cyclase domain-containing protein [Spirulina subsalsa]|uniref:adenylate/guanylate cyclase domain-containing protein n=1 Tax=Spirulina subsalsa TaxID=54311 RepID=UPI0002FC901E|nr:adenylate/guanylate cyclase domain-containing protein [Spirulina subsalsa]
MIETVPNPEKLADILIVDDKVENIRFLSEFLATKNYQVRKAINGKSALTAIRFNPPDLVLLDINMPEMGGYEVCETLKKDPQYCSIPIIFLSAGNSTEDKIKAFAVGGVDYITKPFQLDEVLARVQSQLMIQGLQKNLEDRNAALESIILDLRKTQERLEQSERENQALFNAMNELVVILDRQGNCQKVATPNSYLMGLKEVAQNGKNIVDILPPSFPWLETLENGLKNQSSCDVECALIRNQIKLNLCVSFSPISTEKALCVIRDISEQKKREEALHLIVEGTAAKTGTEFFQSCVRYLAQMLKVRYAFITKCLDGEKNRVQTLAFWHHDNFGENLEYDLAGTPCQEVVQQGKSNCYPDHLIACFPDDEDLATLEARSYQGLPLINSMGEVIGHLAVLDTYPMQDDPIRELVLRIFAARAGAELERQLTDAALKESQEQSEQLLLNILPSAIAQQLKTNTGVIAQSYNDVTILFADLVGFTELACQMKPIELVNLLNELFSSFDSLSEQYGLEKIKTIGDAYMVVGGLPTPRPDHAQAVAEMALEMQKAIAQISTPYESLQIRIGINSGPVVAGVIGVKKFIYDLWGDAVNIASRMESSGEPGKIQVTDTVYERLKHQYHFEQRGTVEVKGRGEMLTYWLNSKS